MRASEFIIETPRVAALRPEILSATDDGKTITIKVRTHDGSIRVLANSNPAVLQQQLNLKYGLRLPHSIARKFVGMPAAMAEDQPDNPDSWESQAADAERDAETVRMADQDANAGGLAEEAVDEDITRRGFLQGAGAAALAGAAGTALANPDNSRFYTTGFTYKHIDVTIAQSLFLYFDTKDWEGKEGIAQNMLQFIAKYLTIEPNRKSIVQQLYQQIKKLRAEAKSNNPELNAMSRESHLKHVNNLESQWNFIFDQFNKGQKPSANENAQQGVTKGSLDEKSTSQAQFRTMAAAAHNPKFAKKVGISRDVAREFHGADKKSNYKSLPRKAAEDASWGMAPEGRGYKK